MRRFFCVALGVLLVLNPILPGVAAALDTTAEPAHVAVTPIIEGEQRPDGTYHSAVAVRFDIVPGDFMVDCYYKVDGEAYWHPAEYAHLPFYDGVHTVEWKAVEHDGMGRLLETTGGVTVNVVPDHVVVTPRIDGAPVTDAPYASPAALSLDFVAGDLYVDYLYYRVDGEPYWHYYYALWGTGLGGDVLPYDHGPIYLREGIHSVEWRVLERDGRGAQHDHAGRVIVTVADLLPLTEADVSGTPGEAGWYTSEVTVSLASAPLSAPLDRIEWSLDNTDWSTYSAPITVDDQGHTALYYRGVGSLGQIEETHVLDLAIDTEGPVIVDRLQFPFAYLNSPDHTIVDWAATDAVSGLNEAASVPGIGAELPNDVLGCFPIVVTARDVAGNITISRIDYRVSCWLSIDQPINPDGSSVFNSGSTVPVKFQLSDASGDPVCGVTARFSYLRSLSAAPGTVNEMPTMLPETGGDLFVESSGGRYSYNWSTKGIEPGVYLVRIALGDGTVRDIPVTLK